MLGANLCVFCPCGFPPARTPPPLLGEVECHQEFKRGKPRDLLELVVAAGSAAAALQARVSISPLFSRGSRRRPQGPFSCLRRHRHRYHHRSRLSHRGRGPSHPANLCRFRRSRHRHHRRLPRFTFCHLRWRRCQHRNHRRLSRFLKWFRRRLVRISGVCRVHRKACRGRTGPAHRKEHERLPLGAS